MPLSQGGRREAAGTWVVEWGPLFAQHNVGRQRTAFGVLSGKSR